jgi:hypothetical protein
MADDADGDGDSEDLALDFSATAVDDAALAALPSDPAIAEVGLARTAIGDEGVAWLAGLPRLRSLDLSATRVTDAGLEPLAASRTLATLRLTDTAVGDAGAPALARMEAVRRLDLSGTKITDAAASALRAAAHLEELDLGGTAIGDAALAELARAPNLRELYLVDTATTEAGLGPLAAAARLEWLNAGGRQFSRAGLVRLAQAPAGEDDLLPALFELVGGEAALDVIANPHRVEAYRIADKKVTAGPVAVEGEELRKLLAALLSKPGAYLRAIDKRCVHVPAIHFRFVKGDAEANLDLCFTCDMVGVIDAVGPAAVEIVAARTEDIDPIRDDLLVIVQQLFPDDAEIAAVKPRGRFAAAIEQIAFDLEQDLTVRGETSVVLLPFEGPPASAAGLRVAQALRAKLAGHVRMVGRDAPVFTGTCEGGWDEELEKHVLVLTAILRDRQGNELKRYDAREVISDIDLLQVWEAWPPT